MINKNKGKRVKERLHGKANVPKDQLIASQKEESLQTEDATLKIWLY